MSRNFKCTFCENYYSTLNGFSQHLKRCKQTFYSSTEESNEEVLEIISDINDISLDSEEFQSVLEGLPSSSKTRENPSQDFYEFEECEEYDEPENSELIEEVLQSQSNEKLRNSEFFEERFRSIEESEIEKPEIEINEFPNEAYADLMTLVTKHNLNNKAGNAIIKFFNKHSNVSISPLPKNIVVGRRYMDKMNSQLSHHKYSILSHNNIEYFIHYCPIVNCIENLLSNSKITKHFAYDYEDLAFKEEKSYGEQFTGNWWKSVNASIPSVAKVLSIILYSDATTLDTLGKSSLHPIYISLGNILTWRRNKEDAKQLLGYLPIISAKDETEKKSSEFKILGAVLRNKENMKKYYDNDTTKEASLEPVYNYFWNIPDLNIYDVTVPDRMHHLDLGLYHYQIEFTKELLSKSSIDKFNRRIAEIPRHPGLKIFAGGLQSIAKLTANEFRDLMKMMVFVVDNLYNKDFSEVYVKWNEMYLLSRLKTFKESDLKIFQKAIDDWANLFIKLFRNISGLKFPKLHSWKYHIINTIWKYGAINGYTTETYESLHKTYVKIPYRLSNKRDVKTQIMKMFSNIAIIMDTDELSNYQSDSGTCYVQALLVTQIVLPNKSLHLALVQWYDFKSWNTPFVYGCPWLGLVEKYNFIEIEVIEEIVHIVPRFDKKNEYFVNKYIF
ncbi:hypothetical protein Glove_536g14 [Diversispora epigaea]|uniref:C2H2-type domain-containing protein n=1 Tax=Diversispora epigaea TaxID=1348612 RepID=A0A397GGH5_9GLOM|nr:hypothetical protein Glove_536g14 [Diversispora epigaea]